MVMAILLVSGAVALVVILRKHAPPEPARLLPGADGFFYVNLQWLRRVNVLGDLPAVHHDPEYQQFIEATGFDFERDLEQAAIAIHYSTGPSALENARFSSVFVAKLDGERLRAYFRKLAASIDNYRSIDIYNIPRDGRTLRLAILGVDTVAASNHDDPQVIRGIVDRSRKLASPFAGPALLRQYYKEVPFASMGWAVLKVQPSAASSPEWSLLFARPAVLVTSIRYLGSLHFTATAFAADEEQARQISEKAGTFLSLFHAAESDVSAPAADPDIKTLLDSVKLVEQRNRAILTAIVPAGLVRKLLAESPIEAVPQVSPPASPPEPKRKSKGKNREKQIPN